MRTVEVKWRRSVSDAVNMRPAFNDVATLFMNAIDQTFESQGRRGGGSWKRLSPKWAARKARKGLDPRILHMGRNHPLRRSLTKRRARGQILNIGPQSMTLESTIAYAARHQFGHDKTPARPYIKLTKYDTANAAQIVKNHLTRQWKRGGTGGRSQR